MPDSKPTDATFADRLRRLREEAGLTRQQAADAAGLEYSAWTDIEEHRRNPTIPGLYIISAAIGVKPRDLL